MWYSANYSQSETNVEERQTWGPGGIAWNGRRSVNRKIGNSKSCNTGQATRKRGRWIQH